MDKDLSKPLAEALQQGLRLVDQLQQPSTQSIKNTSGDAAAEAPQAGEEIRPPSSTTVYVDKDTGIR